MLRTNLAFASPEASVVLSPPVPLCGLQGSQDGLDLHEYIDFLKCVISSTSLDVIRLSGIDVEWLLPFVAAVSDARVVMIETDKRPRAGSSQQAPLFPPDAWNIKYSTTWFTGRRGCGRQEKFIRVANRRRVR